MTHRPFVSYPPPLTGMVLPDGDQLRALRRIVLSVRPWLAASADASEPELERQRNFNRGFWAAGKFFRVRSPRADRFFHAWLEAGNRRLADSGQPPIDGFAFFCGCLAHGDIYWRAPDSSVGALAELGLDEHHGLVCSNRWRDILAGAPLLPPTEPRAPDRSIGWVHQAGVLGVRWK